MKGMRPRIVCLPPPRQPLGFLDPFPPEFNTFTCHCIFKKRFRSNHSVTGGPEQVLLWPGGSGGARRKHRPGGPETRRKHRFSEMGDGRPWPPPSPRRSQRLMIPSGPAGPPGQGPSWPLRRSSIHGDRPPVTEGVLCPVFFSCLFPMLCGK